MSHFELTARELGLDGEWAIQKPALQMPVTNIEYIVTWIDKQMAG